MSKRICVLGDSVVQGFYDFEKGGWVNRLNIFSLKKDEDKPVFNLGVSGNTSSMLLSRMKNELAVRRLSTVMVNVGINDSAIEDGEQRVDLKTFRKNLEKILMVAREFTSEIIFLGLTNVNEKLSTPFAWGNDLCAYNKEIKKYDAVIEKFCREKDVIFVPMQELLASKEIPDGVHPNADGHEKIFQRVKNCLEENKII